MDFLCQSRSYFIDGIFRKVAVVIITISLIRIRLRLFETSSVCNSKHSSTSSVLQGTCHLNKRHGLKQPLETTISLSAATSILLLGAPLSNWAGKNGNNSLLLSLRSSRPEVFLGKGVLKICSKFIGEHPCRSAISIKLLTTSLKSHFRMGVLFRTPLDGCFWSLQRPNIVQLFIISPLLKIFMRTPAPQLLVSDFKLSSKWRSHTASILCVFTAWMQLKLHNVRKFCNLLILATTLILRRQLSWFSPLIT